MKKLQKGFTLIELLVVVAIIGILASVVLASFKSKNGLSFLVGTKTAYACGTGFFDTACPNNELQSTLDQQKKLVQAIPIPQLTTSQERLNVSKRATLFSTPDKISYIYLVSYGKVMAFYTVKGKVSSLQSYLAPMQKIVTSMGNDCASVNGCGDGSGYVVDAPDIDGTYGDNVPGIFFFTTNGTYVEWNGEYMMADQPLQLSTPPEMVMSVK